MTKRICVIDGAPLSLGDEGGSFVYRILPVGEFFHRGYGKLEITPKLVGEIAGNFGKYPVYPVPVKLGHGDGAPAGGTVTKAEARSDGLYITFETDTETAEAIRKRRYRYMSAEYDIGYRDGTGANVGGVITGAGLVNQPGHPGVAPFMLSDYTGEEGKDMDELEKLKQRNAELEEQLRGQDTKKLSDELAEARAREAALLAEVEKERRARREGEVKALCDGWKKGGVPPVLVDTLAPLMLADSATIKLADGREQSSFEVIKTALDTMPKVDMSGIALSDRAYTPTQSAPANDFKAGEEDAKKLNEGRK